MSRIIMGSFPFGSSISEEESFRLLDRYWEAGGRTLDTARSYNGEWHNGDSKSERTIGRWIRKNGVRSEVTLVTKGAYPELRDMHRSRLSPDCIRYDINTSLAVLGVDKVDLFLLHRDDESIPVGEIVDAADEVVADGLADAVGVSNWKTERIAAANEYAVKNGKVPFTVSQILWNMAKITEGMLSDDTLVYMTPEEGQWYRENHFPVMAFTPQAAGFFSKYPNIDSLSSRSRIYATPVNLKRAERVQKICSEIGCSPAALGIAYISCGKIDGYAVIGASNVWQLEDTLTASDLVIGQDIIDEIEND